MGGKGHQINPHFLNIHGNFPHPLRGITVKENSFFFRNLSDGRHRIDRADLIVGQHHRN